MPHPQMAQTRQSQPICSVKSDIVSAGQIGRLDGSKDAACLNGQQEPGPVVVPGPAVSALPNW
jgi:hypothetical protein